MLLTLNLEKKASSFSERGEPARCVSENNIFVMKKHIKGK